MTRQSEEFNQRTMRAIILCVLVAVVYTQIFLAPKQRQVSSSQAPVASVATEGKAAAVGPVVPVGKVEPVGPSQVVGSPVLSSSHVVKSDLEKASVSFVQSDKFQVAISHLGARALAVKLSDYKAKQGEDAQLDLVNLPDGAVFPLGIYVGSESDELVQYSLVAVDGVPAKAASTNIAVATGTKVALEFKGKLANGTIITKRLTFSDGSYLIGVEVVLDKPMPDAQPVWLEWSHFYPAAEEKANANVTNLTYLDGFDKIKHVALKDVTAGLRDYGTTRWISLGDMYFMASLMPSATGRNTLLGRDGDVLFSRVAGSATGGTFSVYAGPKDHKTLSLIEGLNLERAIDLGWFSFLAFPLLRLLDILFAIFNNYGLAIIGLTLVVKTVMLPLSKASFDSMKKMQELQPEIKALRERVKDATQLNQEIFALYQRRGVNPMGGCFPMAIQIPVFLGLYQALLNAIDLRHAGFGVWITDLSSPERLEVFGVGVPVMVLLMAASMIVQQRTMPNTTMDPAQQKMMAIMPFVFAGMFIVFPMPAGLVLYWLVNNLISITQQVYMRNTDKGSVYVATLVASVLIFGAGYLVTLV